MAIAFKVLGIKELLKHLQAETIKEPIDQGIKTATKWTLRTLKASTPVDESRLRPSMTHKITRSEGRVGTNVSYAPFVEYGHRQTPGRFVPAIGARLITDWVRPSHVKEDGSQRFRDEGMFSYTMKLLAVQIKDFLTDMGKEIVARFS